MSTIVTIPAITSALTTLSAVKLDLAITSSGDDGYLNALISQASALIEAYCGRTFGRQTLMQTVRPYRSFYGSSSTGAPIILSDVPVTDIVSVTEDDTLLTEDDYELDADSGLLHRLSGGRITSWGVSTRVEYQAGYVLPNDTGIRTLPLEIENVCLSLIRNSYHLRGQNPNIISEQTEGVGRTQYSDTRSSTGMIDDSCKTILSSYRNRVWS